MRDAAGELADGLHLLRLTEQFFGFFSSFVLGFQFNRAFADGFFQGLGKCPLFLLGALAVGHVNADADNPSRLAIGVVKHQPACLDPAQRAIAGPYDAEIQFEFARLRRNCGLDDTAQARDIVAVNGRDPAVVTSVEIRKPVHRQRCGGKTHGAVRHLPIDHADAADLLGETQKLGAFGRAIGTGNFSHGLATQ
jgi:hypothetical protein